MRAFWRLCRQYLRLYRLTTAIWVIIMALMSYFIADMTPSVVTGNTTLQDLLSQFPQAIRRLFGDPGAYKYSADIFIQGKWLQFMPLLAGIFGALSAMGIMAREIDHHTADFVLSLPVKRSRILAARFAALAIDAALLYIGAAVLLWLGLRQVHLMGSFGNYFLFSLGHYFVTLFFAALTLFLSLCIEDYAVANRYALVIVAGFYSLYIILKGVGASAWLTGLTLFGLIDGEQVVGRGHLPWLAMLVGLLLTLACLLASMRRMDQKQVPA